ncbi:Rha family transcriptional regulator [Alkaliphilus sp. B6464]|uniref:Rha family transcriptional regulator n=1 Tax=Alkaliphilus sp. B6464 TaxID=2731219 RepID=UPI001BA65B33|nr:Rha family transcriptional regulator [Alkaliphilus sp. B6464]QUH21460.1 Rha family transcriptional regulator [Alkaliphilus sp. B6464]
MKSLVNVSIQESTLDSREVTEMVGKRHDHLLRDIENYSQYLKNANDPKVGEVESFFISSTYVDSKGEERPNYKITKKGCEFIAHKLTGQKGAIFTATYINRFHEMDKQLKAPMQELSPQLQLLINMELKQREIEMAITETKQEVQGIRDAMVLDHDSWRKECNTLINKIAKQRGGTGEAYRGVREEVYNLVEQRAGANLKTRIVNKQDRMRREGTSESKVKAVSQVDVIAEDKRLKEIYIAVVKEMAIKYGA